MQKNQTFSSFCSREVALKTLQSDWPKAFWPISQKPGSPLIWDLFKHITIIINFHYRPNWKKKIMTKFSYTFKEPQAWPILGAKTLFSKNLTLSSTTPHGSQTPCWVLKSQLQVNFLTEGQKNLIYRTLLATAGGPIRE